jgi:hypothetical protein
VHYDGGQEIAVVVSPTSAVLELMRRQISQLDGEDTAPNLTRLVAPGVGAGGARWGAR